METGRAPHVPGHDPGRRGDYLPPGTADTGTPPGDQGDEKRPALSGRAENDTPDKEQIKGRLRRCLSGQDGRAGAVFVILFRKELVAVKFTAFL